MSRRISAARMRPGLVVALAALACAGALAQGADAGPGRREQIERQAQQVAWLEQSGRPQEALQMLKALQQLQDEARREERARESARQRELLAVERRSQELERLKLESERGAAELASRDAARRLMVAGALAALLACAVLAQWLLLLRRRQRTLTASRRRLQDSSARDPLTRLFNRRHAEAEMARWQAAGRERVALLLLDVDHFKQVNDSHGHAAGDAVLQGLARRLEPLVRDGDVLARWGGEEFLLLLPGTDLAGALAITRRLLASVGGQPFEAGTGAALRVTVSVGVAVWPGEPGQTWAQALQRADQALYRSKAEGRNRASAALPAGGGADWVTVAGPAAAADAAAQGGRP